MVKNISEVNIRNELSKIQTTEALFRLTSYINKTELKLSEPRTILDEWILRGNISLLKTLSKELVETGKIAPPY